MSRSTSISRLTTGAATVTLALVLTACGGGADTAAPAAPAAAPSSAAAGASQQFNDADVQFAQRMIVHHRQAVDMAALAADRAQSAEVKSLAQEIQAAQDPEIATLTGFLQSWGAEVPADVVGGMPGMGMGGMDMSGMMTPEQMAQMEAASGAEFDRMFLEMMTEHHRSAVTDSQAELANGVNPDAKALAQNIIDAQTAEIDRMQQLLQNL